MNCAPKTKPKSANMQCRLIGGEEIHNHIAMHGGRKQAVAAKATPHRTTFPADSQLKCPLLRGRRSGVQCLTKCMQRQVGCAELFEGEKQGKSGPTRTKCNERPTPKTRHVMSCQVVGIDRHTTLVYPSYRKQSSNRPIQDSSRSSSIVFPITPPPLPGVPPPAELALLPPGSLAVPILASTGGSSFMQAFSSILVHLPLVPAWLCLRC